METVVLLVISCEYGTNAYICKDAAVAMGIVWRYVEKHWCRREHGPMPDDRNQAVDLYFEDTHYESFSVDTQIILQSADELDKRDL